MAQTKNPKTLLGDAYAGLACACLELHFHRVRSFLSSQPKVQLDISANRAELIFIQALELLFAEPSLPDEISENEKKNRVLVLVLVVNLCAAIREVALQIPEVGGLLDLRSPVLGLKRDSFQLAFEC